MIKDDFKDKVDISSYGVSEPSLETVEEAVTGNFIYQKFLFDKQRHLADLIAEVIFLVEKDYSLETAVNQAINDKIANQAHEKFDKVKPKALDDGQIKYNLIG